MFKTFKNLEGRDIAASVFGEESNPLVVFLHGGGQTRFAWDKAAESISQKDFSSSPMTLEVTEIVFGQKREITEFITIRKI